MASVPWSVPGASQELQLPLAQGKTQRFICSLLRRLEFYHFNDTSPQAAIHRRVEVADNAYLRANGSNLASVLLPLRDAEPVDGFVQLKWRTRWDEKMISTAMTSDGSLRIFCLITLLNMPARQLPDILFLTSRNWACIRMQSSLWRHCSSAAPSPSR